MSAKKLQSAFASWSAGDQPLVLATVYETEGSTYSKAGAQMLINNEGHFQGMLSGGCLEGDLAERAATVIASGKTLAVTYDLGQNDEELWGLGVGCDGLMRIFLQPLVKEADYEPFATMTKAFGNDSNQVAITVLESSSDGLPAGATMVTVNGEIGWTNMATQFLESVMKLQNIALQKKQSFISSTAVPDVRLLVALLQPPPRVLVLGAGLDAEPVVRLADELGWRVTISDHRPAYVELGDFAAAEHVHCHPVVEIEDELDLDSFSATIVMSHHLASDRSYLSQLAASAIPYIGLLGPIDRRSRLLQELGDVAGQLEGRLHGPAGLDIGARGPAPIALSIIAEMHQFLMQNSS